MDDERYYRELGALLTNAPYPAIQEGNLSHEYIQWLGRCIALLEENIRGNVAAAIEREVSKLTNTMFAPSGRAAISLALQTELARAEGKAPSASNGAFVLAGHVYDAYKEVGKILKRSTSHVFIVDRYMSEAVVENYIPLISPQARVSLLTTSGSMKTLAGALRLWSQQNPGRSILVKITPPSILHDRLLLVDGKDAHVLTQSLKDLAVHSPASILKVDDELAGMKHEAYRAIWDNARPPE